MESTTEMLLGRGYTSHEHFASVGLIHMNGRMYDAQLGRFLSPDNFIQDPFNTQSFNRYGYAFNNPLKFNDPSGEIAWFIPVIGALVGAYLGGSVANGSFDPTQWDWQSADTWVGIVLGGVFGALGATSIANGTGSLIVSGGVNAGKAGFVTLGKITVTKTGATIASVLGQIASIAFNPTTKQQEEEQTNELEQLEQELSQESPEWIVETGPAEMTFLGSDEVIDTVQSNLGSYQSFSMSGVLGGGIGLEFGVVSDGTGSSSLFFTFSGHAGLSGGFSYNKGVITPQGNHQFVVSDFEGDGAGWEASLLIFGVTESGNFIDRNTQKFGDYGENKRGYLTGSGSIEPQIPKKFSIGASIFRSKTWTFLNLR